VLSLQIGMLAPFVLSLTLAAGPSTSGPDQLDPAYVLVLEESGRLTAWASCPGKDLIAATVGKRTALYRLDPKARKVERLGALGVDAHEVEFSGDCSLLVTGEVQDAKHQVSVWQLTTGQKPSRVATLGPFQLPVSALAVSDDRRWVVVGTNSGQLSAWRLEAKKAVQTHALPSLSSAVANDTITSLAMRENILLCGGYTGWVKAVRLDLDSGKLGPIVELSKPFAGHRKEGSLAPDGEITMPGGGRVFDVEVAGSPPAFFALAESGELTAWPFLTGGKISPSVLVVSGLKEPSALAVSADGKLLAVVGGPGAVWRLDAARKAQQRRKLGGLDQVERYEAAEGAAFLSSGELAVGSFNSAELRIYAVP
jgi:hypothetical protein